MQRFTLIHDGSAQGWQAAYLAFHITAQLGAPLLVILTGSVTDHKTILQRASQIEVGGRAAGVTIETRLVMDFSLEYLSGHPIDGLFAPKHLVPDGKTAMRFIKVLSCPVWIVSKEAELHRTALLVDQPAVNQELIREITILSGRLQQPLTGLVLQSEFTRIPKTDVTVVWMPLPDFSMREIHTVLKQLDATLIFLPASHASLVAELSVNCVVWPVLQDA